MSYDISFTDNTILEADGHYAKVCEIMKRETSTDWMLRSQCQIFSPYGGAVLIVNLYKNGKVYIAEYMPMIRDLRNMDIRFLTHWCAEHGWKTPEPLNPLIDSWKDFWKKQWETFIVDSEYLDNKFGKREDYEMTKIEKDDDEEEEEEQEDIEEEDDE
jgi:hypothetical protein